MNTEGNNGSDKRAVAYQGVLVHTGHSMVRLSHLPGPNGGHFEPRGDPFTAEQGEFTYNGYWVDLSGEIHLAAQSSIGEKFADLDATFTYGKWTHKQ